MTSPIPLRHSHAGGLPIIALDKFIQSTRDSGYRGTANAIAELVDNAIQANARTVSIEIALVNAPHGADYEVTVTDDGIGMDAQTLAQALRFGGSSRFGDRKGIGRFGMGLPNASLSQARRVVVISWQQNGAPIQSYLDVDEIAAGKITTVPEPVVLSTEAWGDIPGTASGTCVIWNKCDRLDNKRIGTITRKLRRSLGRIFRYFLWDGVEITVNGDPVVPVDPLYVKGIEGSGATVFGEPVTIEVSTNPEDLSASSSYVTITFSELPIEQWRQMSNDEKRKMGISNGAGVSIIRGNREVDFGWFFMGGKRKENYDDWWRCEIKFDPELDDAFGITHTKQQIRPRDYLLEALTPTIESTAKALNGRVRRTHADSKTQVRTSGAMEIATERDGQLRPMPVPRPGVRKQFDDLARRHPTVTKKSDGQGAAGAVYHLIEDDLHGANFFKPVAGSDAVCAVINPGHLFYEKLYKPLIQTDGSVGEVGQALQLLLLAAARADAVFVKESERRVLERFREEWSAVLEVLLRS